MIRDDQGEYGYLIPSNFMAIRVCEQLDEIFTDIYNNEKLSYLVRVLKQEIENGIKNFAIHNVEGKKVYAYGNTTINYHLISLFN